MRRSFRFKYAGTWTHWFHENADLERFRVIALEAVEISAMIEADELQEMAGRDDVGCGAAGKSYIMSRRPDYTLNVLNKATEQKGKIGAAEDGSIRVVLGALVSIPADPNLVLTLFPLVPAGTEWTDKG